MASVNELVAEPAFNNKFRQGKAQELISEVLKSKLNNVSYHADNTSTWTREIADDIKIKLKEMNLDRYKFVVQVRYECVLSYPRDSTVGCFFFKARRYRADASVHDAVRKCFLFCSVGVFESRTCDRILAQETFGRAIQQAPNLLYEPMGKYHTRFVLLDGTKPQEENPVVPAETKSASMC